MTSLYVCIIDFFKKLPHFTAMLHRTPNVIAMHLSLIKMQVSSAIENEAIM